MFLQTSPKKYEWSNRNIGRFLVYRAWWLVCKDTKFFLEEKKRVLFSERKLTLHGFTTEVGSTLVWFHYFHSVFFFITCFSSKHWRSVDTKLFQSSQPWGILKWFLPQAWMSGRLKVKQIFDIGICICLLCIWGFPNMMVPNNLWFSY